MLKHLLQDKSEVLATHFKPGFLQRKLTVFQFLFDSGEPFNLTVTDQAFHFSPGIHKTATITLYIKDYDTCWGLLDGSLDGMSKFMSGDYRADGNIVLSQLILYLFKSNDPTLIYEVQD